MEEAIHTQTCPECGRTLPLSAFRKWKNQHGEGYCKVCKHCQTAEHTEQHQQEPPKEPTIRPNPIQPTIHVGYQSAIPAHALTRPKQEFTESLTKVVGHRNGNCTRVTDDSVNFETVMVSTLLNTNQFVTETMLNYRDEFRRHPQYKHNLKRFFEAAEKERERYENMLVREFDEDLDEIDHFVNGWTEYLRHHSDMMYYALLQHFTKMEHPHRQFIAKIEHLMAVWGISYAIMDIVNEWYNRVFVMSVNKNLLSIKELMKKLYLFESAAELQLRYGRVYVKDVPNLDQAMNNIIDRFYRCTMQRQNIIASNAEEVREIIKQRIDNGGSELRPGVIIGKVV